MIYYPMEMKMMIINIQIEGIISINKTLLTTIDSTINIDLLTINEVGSPILQLGLNNRFNNTNVYYDCDNNQGTKIQPNVIILQGDPLGSVSIDPTNQSLVLIDESLSRLYIYPINLTIIDISQSEAIYSTVIIFISNIGTHFPCPSYIKHLQNIVPLTDQEQKAYKSLIIRAFDPSTPLNDQISNITECVINSNIELSSDISIRNLAVIN
ncbi:unnamed protein product [Rotaria sp. Silwood1]|nr:unnamed protein product [Rotaria sp. Silwood1]